MDKNSGSCKKEGQVERSVKDLGGINE